MKLPNVNRASVSEALDGLELWFASIRGLDGYYGPAVGTRGESVQYCGPGRDWRYEGLLDGYVQMYQTTGKEDYLARIERDITEICADQLRNGTFRNSYFEFNPFEGGMPHEPAMLAAAIRARKTLEEAGRQAPEKFDEALERFVEWRLLNELWCKLLKTFNDWLQSSFETYTPHAVAAIIEVLLDYADRTRDYARLEPYIMGAAESLLAVQKSNPAMDGAITLSNGPGSAACPVLAARCLPALMALFAKTGDEKFNHAARRLARFVEAHQHSTGGFTFLIHPNRPATTHPVMIGGAAGALCAMYRAGFLAGKVADVQVPFILKHQLSTGGFKTARGFGNPRGLATTPDWRDVMPIAGWNDKVYHLLAILYQGDAGRFKAHDCSQPVRILGRHAVYRENKEEMRIEGKRTTHYLWKKKAKWAEVSRM